MLDAMRGLIAWTPLGLPAFLFVITLVVFFHELGHFLVARAFGVKVDVFSVGFGKRDLRPDRPRGHPLEDQLAAHRRLCEIRRRCRCRLAARRRGGRAHDRARAGRGADVQAALSACPGGGRRPPGQFRSGHRAAHRHPELYRPCRGRADRGRSDPRPAPRRWPASRPATGSPESTRPRSPISSSCPRSFRSPTARRWPSASIAPVTT